MDTAVKKVVLYGALNWGLGHATRSVPVIKALLREGFEPVIASDGAALEYLRNEFPKLRFEELPAYNIRYGKAANPLRALAAQLPKIFRAQRKEHRILKRLCQKYAPVGVISDNRLGFYHSEVPSVYITHQLKLMLPFARNVASRFHHYFINKFNECWVPDLGGSENLSGEMGHSLRPNIFLKFIGPLSRFQNYGPTSLPKKYDACAILSGLEPQRTLLEKQLTEELGMLEGDFLIVRGTKERATLSPAQNLEIKDFADTDEIAEAIASSKMVISRSGYSSIMDYFFLGNKALLIPTPGQPEQEYLARFHLSKGNFGYTTQEFMDLKEDLKKAGEYAGFQGKPPDEVDWKGLFGVFTTDFSDEPR